MSIQKKVIDLQVGDILLPTKVKVVRGAQVGIKTPKGKCEIIVEYPNGDRYQKTWGKTTTVTVAAPAPNF
jgi:hypothetical protein